MKRDVEELRKKSLGRVLRAMNTNVVICCQMDSAEKATFSEYFCSILSKVLIVQSYNIRNWLIINIFTVTVT